ncbi:hypothetical protein EES46_27020 [Streptomyces sp. ADI98-10]|nr:hypothetical protein EES46_27020 [Streptomyces sp. ADI98-10]
MWANFAQLGHRLPETTGMFERAMGAGVGIVRVLLTASDSTAGERLAGRELGSELEHELQASLRKARLLDQRAHAETVRVVTDGRLVGDIAREVVAATGWTGPHFAAGS